MKKERLLFVEDDLDILHMLKLYFTEQGYEVELATHGGATLQLIRQRQPTLVVLDINLPDMNGYEVLKQVRHDPQLSHMPVILLTEKNALDEKLMGLEMGADDYITKPFHLPELKLRVKNILDHAEHRISKVHPISTLPSSTVIEQKLRDLIRSNLRWWYHDIEIEALGAFGEVYGWQASDEVVRMTARLLQEVVAQAPDPQQVIGHVGMEHFVWIRHEDSAKALLAQLKMRFEQEVGQHYSFIDRERGYLLVNGEQKPMMRLSVGTASSTMQFYADIREIIEVAGEARRRADSNPQDQDTNPPMRLVW